MARWAATVGIALLLALDLALPATPFGRRGPESRVRTDVEDAFAEVGEPFPDLVFTDLQGESVRISDLRGARAVVTFERSVDW